MQAMIAVPPIAMARPRTIRCVGMDHVLSFRFQLDAELRAAMSVKPAE
jgi:hypothetical protein